MSIFRFFRGPLVNKNSKIMHYLLVILFLVSKKIFNTIKTRYTCDPSTVNKLCDTKYGTNAVRNHSSFISVRSAPSPHRFTPAIIIPPHMHPTYLPTCTPTCITVKNTFYYEYDNSYHWPFTVLTTNGSRDNIE